MKIHLHRFDGADWSPEFLPAFAMKFPHPVWMANDENVWSIFTVSLLKQDCGAFLEMEEISVADAAPRADLHKTASSAHRQCRC